MIADTLDSDKAPLPDETQTRQIRVAALLDVNRRLSQLQPLDTLLGAIAAACGQLLAADSVGFRLLDGVELVTTASWGDADLEFADRLKLGECVAGRVAVTAQSILVPDIATHPGLIPAHRAALSQGGFRALLAVPVKAGEHVLGVLSIRTRRQQGFSGEDLALVETFAAQAAIALENARLYHEAQRAYEELATTQAHLIRGETLRAIGELAAGAAHHLNNLFAVVVGRLQLALMTSPSPEIRRHLDPAMRAAHDGAAVVKRLASFSRGRTTSTLVPVDLNQLVADAIEFTRPRWQNELEARGLRVEVRFEPSPIPSIAVDPASIREVLVNLILNAVDAMPHGGRIGILTRVTGNRVVAVVSDTGVGMAPEIQRRALEPFFTTKGVKSTGLGLSLSYGSIQRHGGDLVIDSTDGEGTTVTFTLPVAPVGAASTAIPTTVAPVPARSIVLIDDDQEVCHVIAEMLEEDGHRVIEAASGAEGLARLAETPGVDLVLTDLGMPDMTGWDVARAIKAMHPALLVGLVTGWGAEPQARPEERVAVDFILSKPVTQVALRATMGKLIGPK